ncbi:hypothetical protein [Roseovarius sp. EL26]|uniref:hypothetical protein n=1 Tax=Roseovarius sp. EL26 TaxID=2126672 RepID=UPI0013C3F2A0|nr:hypothetical protein [Roseovarius sp. EL26]
METIYTEKHKLRDSKTELFGGRVGCAARTAQQRRLCPEPGANQEPRPGVHA